MNYHLAKPSLLLSPYVKHYWAIENCVPGAGGHVQRVVPSGLMEMMFFLGDRPGVLDSKRNLSENCVLSGQLRSYYDLLVTGTLSLFSVSFQPYGARLFFDVPSHAIYDLNVPLKILVKDKVTELEDRLFEAGTFEERVRLIEGFLLHRLRRGKKEYDLQRVQKCVGLINRAGGLIDIETLSSSACLSRKQFERTFSEFIGSTPKQFLRTVRFQNTLREKQRNKRMNLTELACACGYFDQSHMINEYRSLSGKTPAQYFSECEPCSDYFQ